VSEERREKSAGIQGTVRGAAHQVEMRQHLAQLKNLASQAFTSAMHTAMANAGASRKNANGFLRVSR
jgi:hypothetical protein